MVQTISSDSKGFHVVCYEECVLMHFYKLIHDMNMQTILKQC